MTRKAKLLRIFAFLGLIVLSGWLAYRLLVPPEPRYQNRTLTEWLVQAQDISYQTANPDHPELDARWLVCRDALLHMGDAVFPPLLRGLIAKESKLAPKLTAISRQKMVPTTIKKNVLGPLRRNVIENEIRAMDRRIHALYGFMLLGEKAKPAQADLVALCATDDREQRYWGFLALTCINPEKPVLLPIATRLLNDPDSEIRSTAAETLHETYPDEAEKAGVYKVFPELRETDVK